MRRSIWCPPHTTSWSLRTAWQFPRLPLIIRSRSVLIAATSTIESKGRLMQLADAQKWQIPNLICFSGNRNLLDDVTGAKVTAEGLSRVAPAAEAAGVNLVLELLNSKVDHPDYQADHTEWGVRVCQAVASPHVKLLYDVYHMQIMEGDIIRTIRARH